MNTGPHPELLYSHGSGVTRLDLFRRRSSSVFQLPGMGTVTIFDYDYRNQVGLIHTSGTSHTFIIHYCLGSLQIVTLAYCNVPLKTCFE